MEPAAMQPPQGDEPWCVAQRRVLPPALVSEAAAAQATLAAGLERLRAEPLDFPAAQGPRAAERWIAQAQVDGAQP